ncbi:Prolyl 4-hydroxylase subunit alpha-2 [Pseudolycoriella hygida]|uniref:procollagen-proline 4-dioxygenase n=1 Tax=Pseudolycoriella hygida TaxID=35572 RepID=A0A9Q0MJB0_9DIPT|nr:Prolyl 4-hydroxylase subunit alpha-2 [Pseudolycoriella hygida]
MNPSQLRTFLSWTVCVGLCLVKMAQGEVFTAITEMEELLDTEAQFISNLESYIHALDQKISLLKGQADDYRTKHQIAQKDTAGYVSNPINAFLLTKRLARDWESIESVVTRDLSAEFISKMVAHKKYHKIPTDEDLNGAAVALARLQETYKLNTTNVANGELNGVKYSSPMTSNDCFEMGRQLYLSKDYYYTISWIGEAMDRLAIDRNSNNSLTEILEYLSMAWSDQGNTVRALQYTRQLLDVSPNHEAAMKNEKKLENLLKEGGGRSTFENEPHHKPKSNETLTYEMLCRKEISMSPAVASKLKCKYVTNRSPFLKIAPLKLEEANLEPYIVVYHDVMFDSEIDFIKELAKPRFKRATVGNNKHGLGVVADYRISKSAWLEDKEHKILQQISRRVEDMTGLISEKSEKLQVVNYGIGGYYVPHLDFKKDSELFQSVGSVGNRIVTVLFYMSDVLEGGATVFPALNVALWPKKGSAAFWYNFLESGKGDLSTLHAACPVLIGSKWVSTKWLHEIKQHFLRPYKLW